MTVTNQGREFARVAVALQSRVGIVLNQRGVGGMKILACPKIAENLQGECGERVMAAFERRTAP